MKKYRQIFNLLENDIKNDIYQVNEFLPSEQELAQHYNVSRDTIRKALALLVDEGLVKKRHGSGTQVIQNEHINFPISELTSYQELVRQKGLNSQTNVISFDKIIVDEGLSEKTDFPIKTQVWRVIRQRIVEGTASVLDIDYIDCRLVPDLSRQIAEHSIYHHIEKDLKLTISHAFKEITIDQADERDKLLLELGNDQHVVCIRSKVYLKSGQEFQFTESRHKLDKFKFIDYAKR